MKQSIRKRKIRFRQGIPPPPPSLADSGKDFVRLMQDHNKVLQTLHRKPLYKNPKLFLGLFLFAVIAMLVIRAFDEEKQKRIIPPADTTLMLSDSLPQKKEIVHPPMKSRDTLQGLMDWDTAGMPHPEGDSLSEIGDNPHSGN